MSQHDLCLVDDCDRVRVSFQNGYCSKHQRVKPMNTVDRPVLTKNERIWHKAQAEYIAEHQCCVSCDKRRLIQVADVVGHVVEPKGNSVLFWDMRNWQALCNVCNKANATTPIPDPISSKAEFYKVD